MAVGTWSETLGYTIGQKHQNPRLLLQLRQPTASTTFYYARLLLFWLVSIVNMACAVNDADCCGKVLPTIVPARLRGRAKDVLRVLSPFDCAIDVSMPICATHRKVQLATGGFDYWDMVDNLTVEQR